MNKSSIDQLVNQYLNSNASDPNSASIATTNSNINSNIGSLTSSNIYSYPYN